MSGHEILVAVRSADGHVARTLNTQQVLLLRPTSSRRQKNNAAAIPLMINFFV